MAQLEASNARLMAGDISSARFSTDNFLKAALSTADPFLQALAWDLHARVAMAENNSVAARGAIEQALAIIEKFEIPVAAWQVCATAWRLHEGLKEHKQAEVNRQRAENCILKIANSFAPGEPLRAKFLDALPVRQILRKKTVESRKRQPTMRQRAAH
jgi:hypothetical protein